MTDIDTVDCPHSGCNKTFATKRGLTTHIGKVHQDYKEKKQQKSE